MQGSTSVYALSIASESLGLLFMFMQLRHILKRKTIKGLSGWGWTLMAGANIAWVYYGYQNKIIALILSNFLMAVVCLLIISRLYRYRSVRIKMILYSLIAGGILSTVFYFFPIYAGWLALAYSSLARLPQLHRAYRDKHLSGISITSQVGMCIGSSIAVLYALILSAWPLALSSLISSISSIFVIYFVAKKSVRAYN